MGGTVIDFRAFNPRKNLPPRVGRKRGESNFLGAFQRAFMADGGCSGVGGRHFALSGYGIADFVWLDCPAGQAASRTERAGAVTAFEMKLHNWKRALGQAHRYLYYSDAAVVVLPDATAARAREHLDSFEHLGVGLWSYDPKAGKICKIFTPQATTAKNAAAREKAITEISGRRKFGQTLKETQPFL